MPLPNHDECRTCGNTRTYDELISGGGTCRECRTQSEPATFTAEQALEQATARIDQALARALARPPVKVILGNPRPNPFGG